MKLKYYLIDGMTKIVETEADKKKFDEDEWLCYLQDHPRKLSVHSDLEGDLVVLGYQDGYEVPSHLFITAAVSKAMEDQFTQS